MGIAYGTTTLHQATKGIVQDGLVLNLDAGVRDSYDSGTTWRDLKGGNDGTLTNMDSANLIKDNGGALTFDGANEHIAYSTDPLNFTSGNFSLQAIFRTTTVGIDVISGHGPNGGDWWFGIINSKLRFSISMPSSKIEPTTSDVVNDNQWKIGVATVDNSTYEIKLYLNGTLASTASGTGSYPNSNNGFSIGKFGVTSFNFPGDIASTLLYNKKLSAAEVLQNFNVMRHRFGI